jgi:hypothetical protein
MELEALIVQSVSLSVCVNYNYNNRKIGKQFVYIFLFAKRLMAPLHLAFSCSPCPTAANLKEASLGNKLFLLVL